MYEVVRVGPNQDVARVVNQFSSQKDMRLITSVTRGTGVELIFGTVDQAVEPPIGATTADAMLTASRVLNADQARYDDVVARERLDDEERRRRAEALIAAMEPAELDALRGQATALLPPLCRGREAHVARLMRDLVLNEGN